jgi:GPH family glycoside/pentoside/hexuronide:cation symporter
VQCGDFGAASSAAEISMEALTRPPTGYLRYARYGALGVPLAFASIPLYVHVPKLYSALTPLNLAAIGIILLAVRSMDMVVDPLIGSLSDGSRFTRGQIMAAAVPVLALGYVALFFPPQLANGVSAGLWLAVSLIVTYLGFSILMINYYAMGVGLADAPAEHTRVALWREAAMLIGVLAASIIPSLLSVSTTLKTAYGLLAVILVALLAITSFITLPMKGLRRAPAQARALPFAILKNHRIRWILLVALVNALPLAITSTLFLFFVEDVLGAPALSGGMLGLYFVSAVVGMPLWSRLSDTIGRINTLFVSMFASVLCFAWAAFLTRGDTSAFYAICFLSGMTLGADTVLLPAIFAEELDAAQCALGSGFGWWNFLNKAALALAAGFALPLLTVGGYHPGAANNHQALALLSASYAMLPCAFKIAAAATLYFSPLLQGRKQRTAAAATAGGNL